MKLRLRTNLFLLAIVGTTICGSSAAQKTTSAPQSNSVTAASYVNISDQNIQRQPLASDLVELAYSPQQNAVFVSSPNWEDEAQSSILRLDPATLAVQQQIPLVGKGFGVALDDAAERMYLTQGFNGSISVVDIAQNRVLKQISVMKKINFERTYKEKNLSGPRTAFLLEQLEKFKVVEDFPYKLREMVVDTKNNRLFAPGLGLGLDSVLFVINTKTLTLEKIMPDFGYNAVGITLDDQNGRLFVSNMRGQVFIVNPATLQIVDTLEVNADQLLNLVYDAKTNRLFGVDQGIDRDEWRNNHLERTYQRRSPGHRVFVLDADTGKTLADMPTGDVPIGLRHDAQRQRLYVTNRGGVRTEEGKGTITVYNTANYQLLQTIPLPPHPNSLALDTDKNILYATVKNDGASKKAGLQESVVRIDLP